MTLSPHNIALSSLVDPPLHIRSEEIPTDANRAIGYLVVHIPASSVAVTSTFPPMLPSKSTTMPKAPPQPTQS